MMTEWAPIIKTSRQIPFGYKEDPEDDWMLLPVPKELELLETAKEHLKVYSYRAVADWLLEQSGRYISHSGLRQRILGDKKKTRESVNLEQLAKKYKKTIEKIQALEARKLGRKYDPKDTESLCNSATPED